MLKSIPLAPGVRLRYLQTPKFKQSCMSIQLLTPMARQTAAWNAMLPNVLLRGSQAYPDLSAITRRMDDLYGAAISPMTRRIGDIQATGFYAGFIQDRFALPGDKVLENVAEFLAELLYRPLLEDGVFRKDYIEGEKRNQISAIEADLNDKRIYASAQLLRAMCATDSFGVPRMGEVSDVEAITADSLYAYYQRLLETAPMEICYVGAAEVETVTRLLQPLFGRIRTPLPIPPQTPFHDGGGKTITQRMEVAQAKLCMGFTCEITNQMPEFGAMQVLNTLFGGGMTSKLFQNVREKLSLCYYISSVYYGTKGILLVSAGVDTAKLEQAKEEILTQLALCAQGKITQEELTAAKATLISALRTTPDSASALEGYYVTSALSGLHLDPQEYAAILEAVTVEQAAAVAGKVRLHTVYCLEGGEA